MGTPFPGGATFPVLHERARPVTIEHEAPLEVLERFPELLPQLLRDHLGRTVPQGARLRSASSIFNLTVAQESRSDGAFVLEGENGQPIYALIIESQRAIDEEKWYSWPFYLAALHRKYRCPTFLIVIAIGEDAEAVATWAQQPVATFLPGSRFAPLVLGPAQIPIIESVEAAKADVPGAVLSTLLHVGDPDGVQVAYGGLRAVYEAYGLDTLLWLYNLIRGIVGEKRIIEIERLIMLDVQRGYFPRTPFEREHFGKGVDKGKAEGKAEAVLGVLVARGIAVSDEQRPKIRACTDGAKLDQMIARVAAVDSAAGLLADV